MKNSHSTNWKYSRRRFLQIVGVSAAAGVCWQSGLLNPRKHLHKVTRNGILMGTTVSITLFSPSISDGEKVLEQTFSAMFLEEQYLSRHKNGSELSNLNNTGKIDNPSSSLKEVLTLSQELSRKTSGAFDVTVFPLVELHEKHQSSKNMPDQATRDNHKKLVGYDKITLKDNAIALAQNSMGISLDGIAKGYIVDKGVSTLQSFGYANVYVEAGGDLMVTGQKDTLSPWRIAIRDPRQNASVKPTIIAISDKAVATSGDYFQPFSSDLKHHHIIDPKTGVSPTELASCTVTAPTVALADGLATSLMVLGVNDGLDFITSMEDCEAYMVTKNLKKYSTQGFFS